VARAECAPAGEVLHPCDDHEEHTVSDPRELFEVSAPVAAELDRTAPEDGLVLVHALRGFIDAGSAGEVAAEHLVERFGGRRLVTFDVDQLLDYRARRPAMTFDVWRWSDYDEPYLAVDLMHDADGRPFLLMHGLEPDVQWERFARAVRDVVERFRVRLVMGMHGIPMGVPHTRPLGATRHGTSRELTGDASWFGTVQVPGSAASLLEYRLGGWGHDAGAVGVHVPHYLAQSEFPPAARTALEHVEAVTGLALDPAALAEASAEALEAVEQQVAEAPEVAAVVRALEEQYDGLSRSLGRVGLLAESTPLPTAEELGAEFERFLAEQAGGGEDGASDDVPGDAGD
jgi:predicted ATP-grasp superfamily ATP-dependent carboligase